MRLIDADTLKEIIGECPENWTDSPEEIEAFDMWHRIMDDIDSTPTINGWVSVKDRMPEKRGRYLLIDKNGIMNIEYWMDGRYERWTTVDSDDVPIITHWMPLPEPPKEEK